jgi:hypothetical protein
MVDNEDIPMMAPYDRIKVPRDQHLRHPVYFFVKEEADSATEIESSPLVGIVYGKAYVQRASVVLYDPNDAPPLLRAGDGLAIDGDRGEKTRGNLK